MAIEEEDLAAGLGTLELTQLAGITFRQADYWTRIGRLKATQARNGQGYPRMYAPEEVEVAKVLKVLLGLPEIVQVDDIAAMVREGQRGVLELDSGISLDLDQLTGG